MGCGIDGCFLKQIEGTNEWKEMTTVPCAVPRAAGNSGLKR